VPRRAPDSPPLSLAQHPAQPADQERLLGITVPRQIVDVPVLAVRLLDDTRKLPVK